MSHFDYAASAELFFGAPARSRKMSYRRFDTAADAIAFAIAAPVAVNIGHMEITPTLQVMGGLQTAKPQTKEPRS